MSSADEPAIPHIPRDPLPSRMDHGKVPRAKNRYTWLYRIRPSARLPSSPRFVQFVSVEGLDRRTDGCLQGFCSNSIGMVEQVTKNWNPLLYYLGINSRLELSEILSGCSVLVGATFHLLQRRNLHLGLKERERERESEPQNIIMPRYPEEGLITLTDSRSCIVLVVCSCRGFQHKKSSDT